MKINNTLQSLFELSEAESRSICAENPTGEKGGGAKAKIGEGSASGPARELGEGWKVNPFIMIKPKELVTLADFQGEGIIQHIWMTPTHKRRDLILRFYWDGNEEPSVECPLGDFFAHAYDDLIPINSLPVCVNPGSAFNCYWNMPFKKSFKITLENLSEEEGAFFYQIDFCLTKLPEKIAYFHAQFRRVNPLPEKEVYTIVDGVRGKGQYVGTYLAWQVNNDGWWGEGEIKFYIDGDDRYPTICGTGTEDYFCGSYNFENQLTHRYQAFSTAYSGFSPYNKQESIYKVNQRFNMYRWHINDPIFFNKDLKVTIQALGWRSKGRYLPLKDDIASVAFWYQTLPFAKFPALPSADELEII